MNVGDQVELRDWVTMEDLRKAYIHETKLPDGIGVITTVGDGRLYVRFTDCSRPWWFDKNWLAPIPKYATVKLKTGWWVGRSEDKGDPVIGVEGSLTKAQSFEEAQAILSGKVFKFGDIVRIEGEDRRFIVVLPVPGRNGSIMLASDDGNFRDALLSEVTLESPAEVSGK